MIFFRFPPRYAKCENLTDETYWLLSDTFASVATPRTFVVSASVDF
jgi:outer membrane receptor protein involved in Fe transport